MAGLDAYGAADMARLRSLQHMRGGRTRATRDLVREFRDERGRWVQEVTDQLGNLTRRRRIGREGEAQDVEIFLPHLLIHARTGEIMAVKR
ncbi:hypothetical protein ACFXJ8_11860 [Nonomuraea sp. NPDC059194]|uniref:hypothetical protein n=1 Tax=Nonomuraea sp. NPDC059194 TaxID=3346764 RepID=UPI0036A4CF19